MRVPLTELGTRTYLGFAGGLYEGGSNSLPEDHAAVGAARARNILPRKATGSVDPAGKIVLLSIGMSNTSQEFCGVNVTVDCVPGSFVQRASADPAVNRSTLVPVNGAQGGMDAREWTSPSARPFDVVRDERLALMGVTEQQVQVVWLLEATKQPAVSLPTSNADAFTLEANLGRIVRALRARYPNLQQVYLSNRIYGGYATTPENPEPYAYETGFAVQWLIQAQIRQMRNGGRIVDGRAGDLNYDSTAPWIAWGPDLWANGSVPRRDGLTWQRSDFKSDGTHPSVESGVPKVGGLLLDFFSTAPTARCWFLAGEHCS
ncbi:MAG TPA: hypothetical protein VJU87_09655 [Gemmatimonadaceae bacterium]|nr:hypothetical protein [Gemmatimonadaceae bacterium]